MRVPIEGEVGVGYVMLEGYDLPPLNFGSDEVEAIVGGLSLFSRTGDKGLQVAAQKVLSKIDTQRLATDALSVSNWGIEDASNALSTRLRESIRNEQKISIRYTGLDASTTQRTVLPLSITYYIKVAVLEAWCKLREDFRHFRVDRIEQCDPLSANFSGGGQRLRKELLEADDQNSKEM
ncbi:hypothetical protein ROBYS_38670 [Roseobacter sp. OBYS 0001]|nr:hypothetical protein ROBYS_38670 [Roseobacter sp. OBYS 0001]